MNSKISVLIPAFNTGRYIAECIESIIAQTYRNLEIIIVDDGSIDDTKAIAEHYALNDSRINVVAISHEGVSYARNVCMSHATGEYILFVDSDDWIGDNLCYNLLASATRNDADIVFSALTILPDGGNRYMFGDRSDLFKDTEVLNGKDCFIKMVDTGATYPMVAGNLYKRSMIVNNKLSFHGKYYEAEYFMPISLNVAKRVSLLQKSEYYHRYRQGSIMHSEANIKDHSLVLGGLVDLIIDGIAISNQEPIYNKALYRYISVLQKRSRALYESYLLNSNKPILLIFFEQGISSKYGIGTYVSYLSDVTSRKPWDVIQVELNARDIKQAGFSIKNNNPCYSFSRLGDNIDNTQKCYDLHLTGIFYYLAVRMDSRKKILCHFNVYNYELLAKLFKEKFNSKIIFTVHYTDWGFRLQGNLHEINRILKSPMNSYEKSIRDNFHKERDFLANCCDCVIAKSEYSYSYLHQLYKLPDNRLHLVHNCVRRPRLTSHQKSTLRGKYGFQESDKIIIYAGRIDEGKGVYELIKAFKKVYSEDSNARLIIAGDGAFSLALKELSPNWSKVCFTGFVDRETLYELYTISDIGVVPSFHEEFGYVAAEMASANMTVVVNSVGGLKYVAEEFSGVTTIDEDFENVLSDRIVNGIVSTKSSISNNQIPRKFLVDEFNEQMKTLYDLLWK